MRILVTWIAILTFAIGTLAEGAFAQTSRRLRVVGVASNDVLNVRESPTEAARIVGIIPPGGRGVEPIGTARGGWLSVRWGDVEGWALGTFLAEDAPLRRGRAPDPAPRGSRDGWWLLLGSFSDPAGTPASVARTSDLARQCGLRAFAAPSNSFSDLARGYTVVVVGPFPSRSAAEGARAQALPCIPQAYVKQSAFGG